MLTREWEFKTKPETIDDFLTMGSRFEMSAADITKHFEDLDDHPKFAALDSNTKLLHKAMRGLFVAYKSGGTSTVGKHGHGKLGSMIVTCRRLHDFFYGFFSSSLIFR